MAPGVTALPHNRSLLDPSFDCYKLHFLDPAHSQAYRLVSSDSRDHDSNTTYREHAFVDELPLDVQLSLEQTSARLTHGNILIGGYDRRSVYLLTQMLSVLCVRTDLTGKNAEVHNVFTIPSSSNALDTEKRTQMPSLRCTRSHYVVVSDGNANLFVIDTLNDQYRLLDKFMLQHPFVLLDSNLSDTDEDNNTLLVLVYHTTEQSIVERSTQPVPPKESVSAPAYQNNTPAFNLDRVSTRPTVTEFIITLLEIDIINCRNDNANANIRTLGAWRSFSHPYQGVMAANNTIYMASKNGFTDIKELIMQPDTAFNDTIATTIHRISLLPSFETYIALERQQHKAIVAYSANSIDNSLQSIHTTEKEILSHYKWTQTDTDVTLHITLPFNVSRQQVNCYFTSTHLKLQVHKDQSNVSLLLFDGELWAPVVATDCIWTMEHLTLNDEKQPQFVKEYSTLSIHLEKQDAKTRWLHIMLVDDNVLETVDPSELRNIREQLEKYTTTAAPGSANQLEGNEVYIPPGEETEDVDMEGDGLMVQVSSWEAVTRDTSDETPSLYFRWNARVYRGVEKQYLGPSILFHSPSATNHQMSSHVHANRRTGLTVRYDVDGLVYELHNNTVETLVTPEMEVLSSQPLDMTNSGLLSSLSHVSTFHAFGYVQASKRDRRFMLTSNEAAVVCDATKYMYLYMRRPSNDNIEESCIHQSIQYVIDVRTEAVDHEKEIEIATTGTETYSPPRKRLRSDASTDDSRMEGNYADRIVGVAFVHQRLLCVLCANGRLLYISLHGE